MQFNVAQLLKEPTGSIRRYELVEDITELDPELVVMGPLVGDVQLLRINSGILVEASLSTAVRVTCNRCLAPIATPVRFTIEESFRPLTEVATGRYLAPDEFEGAEKDLEDEALIIDEHHILDLSEVVRQTIWLALPMYPSCIWNGPGECPNLIAYREELEAAQEEGEVAEGEEAIDPRWSALLALRKRLDNQE
ncbi:MAG TPA: DUF177 domain-containing protein [Caldilineaceae bacterium]|nr:DUF177 domain-containing protein [Caldilineaceae bacterium]